MIERKFQDFLDSNGIRHFQAREVLFLGHSDQKLKLNSPPPESIWGNIIPTLKILDELRDELGEPIKLLSIFRNQQYNRRVGGSPNSQHLHFRAVDFFVNNLNKAWDCLIIYRQKGKFSGGLGKYPTFIHIDTRGSNATWYNK